MLHDLWSSLTLEQRDFLQAKVAELKAIKDKIRFKRTLKQTAQTLNIPEFVCLIMVEEVNLFSVNANYAYSPEERTPLLIQMTKYRRQNNSNILFESLYAENPDVTKKLIGVFSKMDSGIAAGLEKDDEGRGLVAHCILSGKLDLLPRVEEFLGRAEYKNQLDALSEEQTIVLFKNGSDALRADLIERIKAMNINGFRVDQILSEQGINYYLSLDAPFPPSLESINASEVRNTAEFFTPEAYRLVTQNLIQTSPEGALDYQQTLNQVAGTFDTPFFEWVLQSNAFQQVAAYENNRLFKMAINSDGGRMTEIALALLRVSSVISTAHNNNNELLKLAINRGQFDLVAALLDIPAVQKNVDISLIDARNGDLNQLLIPHLKWYGQPLNLILTPEAYETTVNGLVYNTARTLNIMHTLNDFIAHCGARSTFTLINLKIMRILESHELVKRANANDADYTESAMGSRAHAVAAIGAQKAGELYGEAFRNHPNGLEGVEARIRGMILDEILSDPVETVLTPAQRQFIETNRDAILLGNDENKMNQVREQFDSNTNPSHIAWRAYDQFAPKIQFENLLTSEAQYGRNLRERVAHYYLGLVDPVYQAKSDMTFENRRGVFIGTIAEIRRAHNEGNPDGVDNPSCQSGTIGRIPKMGAGHEVLQIVEPIDLIPEIIGRILSERLEDRLRNESDEVKAKFALALIFLNEQNIPEILRNNDMVLQDILGNDIPVSELMLTYDEIIFRLQFNCAQNLPRHHNRFVLLDEINRDLRLRRNPEVRQIEPQEHAFITRQVNDLAFEGVGQTVSNAINQQFKPDMERINPKDPYNLAELNDELKVISERARNPKLKEIEVRNKKRQIRTSEEKTDYFKTVFDRLRGDHQLESVPLNVLAFLAKNMVEKAYNSDDFDDEDPRFTLKHLKAAYESLRETKQFQVIPFLEEHTSARNEVIAEIDDKGKEEEETPKSIVHGFNHLRLSSSSNHANVAESSSSASMRLV